jgi:urocanate hydratase
MLMIMNNLDPAVAQFPEELITYGGNGSVLSNWAQYHLLMYYLSRMTDQQTLTMSSGHPNGLWPSSPSMPRVVITNGLVIPNHSSPMDYDRLYALGVSQYGQMTAGSYCYIGPQGIVHGTTITILNAGRKYLGSSSLAGKVYVSSGLGGMSGAQGKAGSICGAISVIAEVDFAALNKRHKQGWVHEVVTDLDSCIAAIRRARAEAGPGFAIAYHGNIVDLWERLAEEKEMLVELGSDQTSLHNPYGGGYYPVGLSFADAKELMVSDRPRFKQLVQASLRRHAAAINALCARGMKFWDYGNAFLLEAARAGADVGHASGRGFRYPSYVEEIMGDVFALGFGPFRWVCTSMDPADLKLTDRIAASELKSLRAATPAARVVEQIDDNIVWIEAADANGLVVGSQARILYADANGRRRLAAAFNRAVSTGELKGPVVLSRDHHDVSGTDSPFRETASIYDGSQFCADMSVQNCIGDAMRGATWVALHNGGGVGWGEVSNGGFGCVVDGSDEAGARADRMLHWDVNNGVARRAWCGNDLARGAISRAMEAEPLLEITMPNACDAGEVDAIVEKATEKCN